MVPLDDRAHQQVTNRSLDNSMYWIIKWPVGVLDRPKEPFYSQLSMPNNFHKSNDIPDIKSKERWTISHDAFQMYKSPKKEQVSYSWPLVE